MTERTQKYLGENTKVDYIPVKSQEVVAKGLKVDFKNLTEQEKLILKIHLQRIAIEKLLKLII